MLVTGTDRFPTEALEELISRCGTERVEVCFAERSEELGWSVMQLLQGSRNPFQEAPLDRLWESVKSSNELLLCSLKTNKCLLTLRGEVLVKIPPLRRCDRSAELGNQRFGAPCRGLTCAANRRD